MTAVTFKYPTIAVSIQRLWLAEHGLTHYSRTLQFAPIYTIDLKIPLINTARSILRIERPGKIPPELAGMRCT